VTPQRAYPRYALEVDAEVRAANRRFPGRTNNVSRGGLCFLSSDPLPLGEEVDLILALVFDAETHSEPLALRARIVWSTQLSGGQHQIGAAFVHTTGEQRAYINLFIEFLARGRNK
jgi:hypothetical protein